MLKENNDSECLASAGDRTLLLVAGSIERLDVIGYRLDPEVNDYSLFFERVRLEKGTVMSEWQDENGQWWRGTVVKDTRDLFKSVTVKIDAPDREAPRADAQAAARE